MTKNQLTLVVILISSVLPSGISAQEAAGKRLTIVNVAHMKAEDRGYETIKMSEGKKLNELGVSSRDVLDALPGISIQQKAIRDPATGRPKLEQRLYSKDRVLKFLNPDKTFTRFSEDGQVAWINEWIVQNQNIASHDATVYDSHGRTLWQKTSLPGREDPNIILGVSSNAEWIALGISDGWSEGEIKTLRLIDKAGNSYLEKHYQVNPQVHRVSNNGNVWILETTTMTTHNLVLVDRNNQVLFQKADPGYFAISRDDRKIAFTESGAGGSKSDFYLQDLSGGPVQIDSGTGLLKFSGERLFLMKTDGTLVCFDAATASKLWEIDKPESSALPTHLEEIDPLLITVAYKISTGYLIAIVDLAAGGILHQEKAPIKHAHDIISHGPEITLSPKGLLCFSKHGQLFLYKLRREK